jgi:tetratricopeptide (TPR) repeat protein
MSLRISQWIGLIGIAATIPLVQTVAVAKSPVEINRIAKSITVLITSSSGQGSGVILQRQGGVYTVLTAAHVVRKKVDYKITTPDNLQYEVISSSIRTSPGDIDLAVVKFRATNNYTTVKLGNCNKIEGGMDIYVTGFPAPDEMMTSVTFAFRKALVTGNSNKVFRDGYSLVYDGNTLPGMSGGGVFNSDGELIAIHGKGDRNKDENGKNAEKNNYNAGISINRFGMVASRMGVNIEGKIAAISQSTELKAEDYFVSGVIKTQPPNGFVGHIEKEDIDYKGALSDFNRAVQLNPMYIEAYKKRADLKKRLGDGKGALVDYNRAIQLNPNDYDSYYQRANLRSHSGISSYSSLNKFSLPLVFDFPVDREGALSDYSQIIRIKPEASYAYSFRGSLREDLNDNQGALSDYNQMIKFDDSSFHHNIRATFKKDKLGDYMGALTDYNHAIEKIEKSENTIPRTAKIYFDRAILKFDYFKDRSGGITDMKKAVEIYKYSADKGFNKADYEKAVNLLNKWKKDNT